METKLEKKDCGQCDFKYETLEELMYHMRKSPEHEAKCVECNTTYISLTIFRQHLRKLHFNKGKVVCSECGKESANQQQQFQHWHYVHRVDNEDLFCNLCGKGWPNLSKLKKHTRKCLHKDPVIAEKERRRAEEENPKCAEQVFTWTKVQYLQWKEQKLSNNNNENSNKKSGVNIKKEKMTEKDAVLKTDDENSNISDNQDRQEKSSELSSKKRKLVEEDEKKYEIPRDKKIKSMDATINLLWNGDDNENDNIENEDLRKADEEEELELGYDLLWSDNEDINVETLNKDQEEIKPENENINAGENKIEVTANEATNLKDRKDPERERISIEDNKNHIKAIEKIEEADTKQKDEPTPPLLLGENVEYSVTIKSEMDKETNKEGDSQKKYKCPAPDCPNSYTDGSNYRRHYRKKHKSLPEPALLEQNPNVENDTNSAIVESLMENKSEPQVKTESVKLKIKTESNVQLDSTQICPHCGKVFETTKGMSFHISQAHEMVKFCQICQKDFDNFPQHKEQFHPPSADDLTCKECNTTLKTRKSLRRHMREQHENDNKLICPVCSKMVHRSHINQAHKEEPSICDICSALFKNKHGLRGHKRKVHGDIENVPCPQCDQVIETKYKLYQHIYAVHNLQESPCDQCGKSYKNIKLLQAHKKIMHPDVYISSRI